MSRIRTIGRIGTLFASRLDNEDPILLVGILPLIPLRLMVTHKTLFIVPYRRVGATVAVELIAPRQSPLLC